MGGIEFRSFNKKLQAEMSSNVILEFWCGSGSRSGSRSQKSLVTSHKFDTGKISELVWEKLGLMLIFLLTFVQKNVLMFVNHDCCVDPGEMRAPTLFPSCLPDLIDSSISAEEQRQLPCKAKMSRSAPLPAPDKNELQQ